MPLGAWPVVDHLVYIPRGPLSALAELGPEHLPSADASSREHRMYQRTQRRFLSWSERRGPGADRFERLDQPLERTLGVFESIDQDRAPAGKTATGQLGRVGYRA